MMNLKVLFSILFIFLLIFLVNIFLPPPDKKKKSKWFRKKEVSAEPVIFIYIDFLNEKNFLMSMDSEFSFTKKIVISSDNDIYSQTIEKFGTNRFEFVEKFTLLENDVKKEIVIFSKCNQID